MKLAVLLAESSRRLRWSRRSFWREYCSRSVENKLPGTSRSQERRVLAADETGTQLSTTDTLALTRSSIGIPL